MGISLKTHKILWGRSGNMCAICGNELIVDAVDSIDDPSIIGDEAHIIAKTASFTRGEFESLSPEQRDHYSNLILLCKAHHKQVDDQTEHYTVERLREIKRSHEEYVKANWTKADEGREQDDILYSDYIDEWERRAELANWLSISGCITSSESTLPKRWYDKQREFLVWFLGRIWPGRYSSLENSLQNYAAVLDDFLELFHLHAEPRCNDKDLLTTERFYKIPQYDEKLYNRLLHEYEEHECLVNDLFFELTRAANYVCDRVRENLFPGYRLQEGVLIVVRSSVGFALRTEYVRLEYRGDARTKRPYPGLEEFKKARYTLRDYALDPDDSQLQPNRGKNS